MGTDALRQCMRASIDRCNLRMEKSELRHNQRLERSLGYAG
jgi:hypothetical protein